MALSRKDIADLRLKLIRGLSVHVDLHRGAGDFVSTFQPVIGELLARADAFEKIRAAVLALHLPNTSNMPAELRQLRQRVQAVIQEFDELLAAAERAG